MASSQQIRLRLLALPAAPPLHPGRSPLLLSEVLVLVVLEEVLVAERIPAPMHPARLELQASRRTLCTATHGSPSTTSLLPVSHRVLRRAGFLVRRLMVEHTRYLLMVARTRLLLLVERTRHLLTVEHMVLADGGAHEAFAAFISGACQWCNRLLTFAFPFTVGCDSTPPTGLAGGVTDMQGMEKWFAIVADIHLALQTGLAGGATDMQGMEKRFGKMMQWYCFDSAQVRDLIDLMYGARFFRRKSARSRSAIEFHTVARFISSEHVFDQCNGGPLGCSPILPVGTGNCV
jgi:hypothetical protein